MAVQAQHLPHDLHACNSFRDLEDEMTGGSLFFADNLKRGPELVGVPNTLFGDVQNSHGFVPRKRARVVPQAPSYLDNQRTLAAASTSGRMINAAGAPQDLLSQLYHQGMEIDAVLRVETDRMRVGLEEARQQHVRALVSVAERAAATRLRAADAALELARCRNAKLSERLSQICAEGQAWIRVAKSHEAVAAGLQATLDQLLQSPCAAVAANGADEEGDAEDARSCCFETPAGDDAAASKASAAAAAAACRACGEGESCVLLLPCRHLCLCSACDAAVDTCPLCATTKNASLHVLLS